MNKTAPLILNPLFSAMMDAIETPMKTKAIQPHDLLRTLSPDTCAECLSVSEELYASLWRIMRVAKVPADTFDNFSTRAIGRRKHWNLLTDAEKTELNERAVAYDLDGVE